MCKVRPACCHQEDGRTISVLEQGRRTCLVSYTMSAGIVSDDEGAERFQVWLSAVHGVSEKDWHGRSVRVHR